MIDLEITNDTTPMRDVDRLVIRMTDGALDIDMKLEAHADADLEDDDLVRDVRLAHARNDRVDARLTTDDNAIG